MFQQRHALGEDQIRVHRQRFRRGTERTRRARERVRNTVAPASSRPSRRRDSRRLLRRRGGGVVRQNLPRLGHDFEQRIDEIRLRRRALARRAVREDVTKRRGDGGGGAAAAAAPGARDPPGTPTACARHNFASDVANLAPTGPTALAGAPAAFESDSAAAARRADDDARARAGIGSASRRG